MRRNDKGFTLLEMIVAFALLGLVSVAVIGFIGAGASSYRMVSQEVNLQFEAQIIMNQLRAYIINCNHSLGVKDGALYVINEDAAVPNNVVTAYVFNRDNDSDELRMAVVHDADPDEVVVQPGTEKPPLMGKNVSIFDVTVVQDATTQQVTIVQVTLGMQSGASGYTLEQNIAMRNAVEKYIGSN